MHGSFKEKVAQMTQRRQTEATTVDFTVRKRTRHRAD